MENVRNRRYIKLAMTNKMFRSRIVQIVTKASKLAQVFSTPQRSNLKGLSKFLKGR